MPLTIFFAARLRWRALSMTPQSKFIVALVGCALAIWWLWPRDPAQNPAVNSVSEETQAAARARDRIAAATRTATLSPFSKGAATPPSRAETIAIIRAALKDAGMRTPDRYYAMGFKELRSLADQGNIYAQIQLGAQYTFANYALEYDPDYDFQKNPRIEAFKLFRTIALKGNVAAVQMLSTKLADVDPVEAYSWKLLSAGDGAESQREFFKQNQYEFQLTPRDLANANARSQQLLQQMMSQQLQPLPAD